MGPAIIILIVFVIILTYVLKRNSRLEREASERFWEMEAQSNNTRKKDISTLPYITVPLASFPIGAYSDKTLADLENSLTQLSKEAILNLNGISNTELKLTYGVANLDALSQCDERFTELIKLLHQYGSRLLELSHTKEAVCVLRFAVECGSDIPDTYTTLADAYAAVNEPEHTEELKELALQLHSSRRDAIVTRLDARLNA